MKVSKDNLFLFVEARLDEILSDLDIDDSVIDDGRLKEISRRLTDRLYEEYNIESGYWLGEEFPE